MKERIPFVDWLRATACFMVMLVHSAEHFYGVVTEKAIESIPGGAGLPSTMVELPAPAYPCSW